MLTTRIGDGYNVRLGKYDSNQMLTIGLTGGIGTGKSEVARILGRLGATVLDADRLTHAVYGGGTDGHREVVRAFGSEVVGADGEIDRRRLADLVFGNAEQRRQLESIVWSRARETLETRIREERGKGTAAALVVEAVKLLEAGWGALCDEVWVVVAPDDEVVRRLRNRNGITGAEARTRMRARKVVAEQDRHATATIRNEGGLEDLAKTVESLWRDRVLRKA